MNQVTFLEYIFFKENQLQSQIKENFRTLLNLLFNPLITNPTEWSNTLKQFKFEFECEFEFLSVLDHFVGFALKRLRNLRTNY